MVPQKQTSNHMVLCRETSSTQWLADMLDSNEGGWCLTSEATLWARSTVWSRAFNISKGVTGFQQSR